MYIVLVYIDTSYASKDWIGDTYQQTWHRTESYQSYKHWWQWQNHRCICKQCSKCICRYFTIAATNYLQDHSTIRRITNTCIIQIRYTNYKCTCNCSQVTGIRTMNEAQRSLLTDDTHNRPIHTHTHTHTHTRTINTTRLQDDFLPEWAITCIYAHCSEEI